MTYQDIVGTGNASAAVIGAMPVAVEPSAPPAARYVQASLLLQALAWAAEGAEGRAKMFSIGLHCRLIAFNHFGEPHLLCFFEDIRERKQAERAMAQRVRWT